MRMTAAQVESIINSAASAKPRNLAVDDYADLQQQIRDEAIQGFAAQKSQSHAREGEILPPPPKSLATISTGFDDIPEDDSDLPLAVEKPPEEVVPPSLLGIDLDSIKSRAELLFNLVVNLPLNELNLPKYLYRADLLDFNLFRKPEEGKEKEKYDELVSYLDAARLELHYHEGFPTLPGGDPLWARLPFESPEQHAAFLTYCEQPGARQINRLSIPGQSLEQLTKWFHECYWGVRVKCYDMLHAIHAAKIREDRIFKCEDNHYLEADKLFKQLTAMQGDVAWASLAGDPKEYVAVLEKVVKLQRLALGQSTMGAADKREIRSDTVEAVMRKITALPESQKVLEDATAPIKGMTEEGINIRKLLQNPGTLATAQELIIRMSSVTTVLPEKEDV